MMLDRFRKLGRNMATWKVTTWMFIISIVYLRFNFDVIFEDWKSSTNISIEEMERLTFVFGLWMTWVIMRFIEIAITKKWKNNK